MKLCPDSPNAVLFRIPRFRTSNLDSKTLIWEFSWIFSAPGRDLITNTHNPQLLKPPLRTSDTYTPPTTRWTQTSSPHTNGPVQYSTDRTDKHLYNTAYGHYTHTLHIISFFTVQKTICCNSTSNAPDDGRMYPKHVELRIHQYNYLVASRWHFTLFHME